MNSVTATPVDVAQITPYRLPTQGAIPEKGGYKKIAFRHVPDH